MKNSRKAGEMCWLDIKTSDMKATQSFYKNLFGWEYHNEDWPHKVYTIAYKDGKKVGGLTDLSVAPLPAGTKSHNSVYLAAHCIDDMTNNCEKFNGLALVEPFDLENFMRMSVIQDPGGAVFSLMETGTFQPINTDRGKEGVPGWIELIASNLSKSTTFYAEIFGWTFIPQEKDLPASLYVQCRDRLIGKITEASSQPFSSQWVVYYTVNDIERKVQHAQTLGVQRVSAVQELPNIGKSATLIDSAGIHFGQSEISIT